MLKHVLKSSGINVYEQEPGFRTLQFADDKNYYLYLPYMVYILHHHLNGREFLSVGFRTQPLNTDNLQDEILLFPPLPNICLTDYVVCCKPDIDEFWYSKFSSNERWTQWPGVRLLRKSELQSYENWCLLSPQEVMRIFANWPKGYSNSLKYLLRYG